MNHSADMLLLYLLLLADLGSQFLQVNLPTALTDDNVFEWLATCSKLDLCGLASTCISYIGTNCLALPAGFLASLNVQQTEQLFEARCDALVQATNKESAKVAACMAELKQCARPQGTYCWSCKYALFIKPNGKIATYCMNCGKLLY
jgi:hypothetical protein